MTGLALIACKLAVLGGVVITTCFSVTWFHNVELKEKGGKRSGSSVASNQHPSERV